MEIKELHKSIIEEISWTRVHYPSFFNKIYNLRKYYVTCSYIYHPKPIKIRIFDFFINTNLKAKKARDAVILNSCEKQEKYNYHDTIGSCMSNAGIFYQVGDISCAIIGRYKINNEFIYCGFPSIKSIFNLALKNREMAILKFINLINHNNTSKILKDPITEIVDYVLQQGNK